MYHINNSGIHRTSQYTSYIHFLSLYLSATIVTQGSVKSSQLQNTTITSYFIPPIPVWPVSKHVHASELSDKSVFDCRKELEEVHPQYHRVPTAHSCISIKSPLYLLPIYILSSNSRVISADHLLVPVILLYAADTLVSLSCHWAVTQQSLSSLGPPHPYNLCTPLVFFGYNHSHHFETCHVQKS